MAPESEDSSLGFIIYWLWDDGKNYLRVSKIRIRIKHKQCLLSP